MDIGLPEWAVVGPARRAHIERVAALLDLWAARMTLDAAEAAAWRDAAWWHDALRDAPEDLLRALCPGSLEPAPMLHGPAAAARLAAAGEHRPGVLDAVRYHTVGWARWDRTGRALYMADYLDPGRPFSACEASFLAAQVPYDFDGVFRQVVRLRLEWTLRECKALHPLTVELWNDVR